MNSNWLLYDLGVWKSGSNSKGIFAISSHLQLLMQERNSRENLTTDNCKIKHLKAQATENLSKLTALLPSSVNIILQKITTNSSNICMYVLCLGLLGLTVVPSMC